MDKSFSSECAASIWLSLFFIVDSVDIFIGKFANRGSRKAEGEPRPIAALRSKFKAIYRNGGSGSTCTLFFSVSRERIMTASEVKNPGNPSFTACLSDSIFSEAYKELIIRMA